MPVYSSLRTFIDSLKTGDTNTTKTFARALAAPGSVGAIRDKASVDPHLSDQLKAILAEHGMRPEEIAHVENEWPAAKRNQARLWVLAAVAAGREVTFKWELFDGDDPANRRNQPPPPQPIRITFRSPGKGVRLSQSHSGQVHVDR